MKEPMDFGNEHESREEGYRRFRRWTFQESMEFLEHLMEEELTVYEHYQDECDSGEHHLEHSEHDTATEHQDQYEYGDSPGARYAAAKFPEFRRRGRGLVAGEEWKPPYLRRPFMPVFKMLNPAQPEADPGYDDWIPYHEEEPPMP